MAQMRMDDLEKSENRARRRDWLRLAACVAAIWVAWLVVLPMIARTSTVRQRIARDEAMGVNPSAKFYSELPATPRILARVAEWRRRATSVSATMASDRAEGSGTP